ncbi:MAG TPA: sulfurtransferase [Rudaea sp.]|jgi:thiosulfate/3-mercaptopyruvate sulfurtransferase
MNARTLIDVAALNGLLGRADVLIVDCRADIADPQRAARDYTEGHVAGAVHADLERELSDLSKQGLGRHPLPNAEHFSMLLSRWGWTPQTTVVAYDNANGALAATRLWWMLRLIGHRAAAVLDGGLGAWNRAGYVLTPELPTCATTEVHAAYDAAQIVYTDELRSLGADALLVDARAAPRFRGDVEPIDPVAGHVPGAANRPFSDNLEADGRFKSAAVLRDEFGALLGSHKAGDVVHMCGSGVTACHNLLAMEHAGLSGSRVYAPSWSGWIADPSRPVVRGTL